MNQRPVHRRRMTEVLRAVAATMDKLRFVRQLRELREELGVSQDELARRVATTQSAIARFERRERVPTFEVIEKVARALGVRLRVELERRPSVS